MAMSPEPELLALREQVAHLLADNAHLHARVQELLALVGELRGTVEKQQDHIAKLVTGSRLVNDPSYAASVTPGNPVCCMKPLSRSGRCFTVTNSSTT